MIDMFFEFIISLSGNNPYIATFLLSMMPVFEIRLAIPFGINASYWLSPLSPTVALLISFLGSTLSTAIILQLLKLIKIKKDIKLKYENQYFALSAFTAIPLPLTGAYSASIISRVLKLSFLKSLIAISIGNLIAGLIILLSISTLKINPNYFTIIFLALTLLLIGIRLIKTIMKRKYPTK